MKNIIPKTWFNDRNIPIVQIDSRYICLVNWNGETWNDCWETSDGYDVQSEGINVKPVYDSKLENIIDYDLF